MLISISVATFDLPTARELRELSEAKKASLQKRAEAHFAKAIKRVSKELASLEAERDAVMKKLSGQSRAAVRVSAPKVVSVPTPSQQIALPTAADVRDLPARFDSSMRGAAWNTRVNANRVFPPRRFGYWRSKLRDRTNALPFPIAYTPKGYDKKAFVAALTALQNSDDCTISHSRGFSPHRWTGKDNGSREYEYKGHVWPEGYITYLKAGVPPSRKFYSLVTGKDLATLPDM